MSEDIEGKVCTKCKVWQGIDQYCATARHEDGSIRYRSSWCRECKNKAQTERSRANGAKEKIVPLVFEDAKECLECREIKNVEEFSPSTRGRLGRAAYCRPCSSLRITRQPGFKEKARKSTQKYRDENRLWWRSLHRINQFNRRARQKAVDDGTVTKEFVESVYAKLNCYWCGFFVPESLRTLEHIVELSEGGLHSASNITMACSSCNSSRKGKTRGNQSRRKMWNFGRSSQAQQKQRRWNRNSYFRNRLSSPHYVRNQHSPDAI